MPLILESITNVINEVEKHDGESLQRVDEYFREIEEELDDEGVHLMIYRKGDRITDDGCCQVIDSNVTDDDSLNGKVESLLKAGCRLEILDKTYLPVVSCYRK